MSSPYSDESVRLARKLSFKVVSILVKRYDYTVWSDVKTRKIQYLRPKVRVDNWVSPKPAVRPVPAPRTPLQKALAYFGFKV